MPQNHAFHYISRFVPKISDMTDEGRKFEVERRSREPQVDKKIHQEDDTDDDDEEDNEEEDAPPSHSICTWDLETTRKKGFHPFKIILNHAFSRAMQTLYVVLFIIDGTLVPYLAVIIYEANPEEPLEFWSNERDGTCIKQVVLNMIQHQQMPENKNNRLTALAHNGEFACFPDIGLYYHLTCTCCSGASFDHVPLLKAFLEEIDMKPEVLANGQKLLQLKLKQYRLRFIDSFLFTHLSLARLGPAFEIEYSKTWSVTKICNYN